MLTGEANRTEEKRFLRLTDPDDYRPLFPELGQQLIPVETQDSPNLDASFVPRRSLRPDSRPATPEQIKRAISGDD